MNTFKRDLSENFVVKYMYEYLQLLDLSAQRGSFI